ncbi:MAG TPA: hypothetical protein PKC13_20580, partial [Blastocatellia bacterium]|nr:hypothetical protein [Blastocatellia bacterium]
MQISRRFQTIVLFTLSVLLSATAHAQESQRRIQSSEQNKVEERRSPSVAVQEAAAALLNIGGTWQPIGPAPKRN